METPNKRHALSVLDANVNASPRSPFKYLKQTPSSELRKRPLDLFAGTIASPAKRPCPPKTKSTTSGLQPSPVLSHFPLEDQENLPPPVPTVGMSMHMKIFEASPDASRAFLSACASSPITGMVSRPRARTMSRREARQKAEALRLRLGLANYKLKTGQTDVPLDQLQMKPWRTNFRHSISFLSAPISNLCTTAPSSASFNPSTRAHSITDTPPSYVNMTATARHTLGVLPTFNDPAIISSSPMQPSSLREREQRDHQRVLPRMAQLPTPMASQEELAVRRAASVDETPVRRVQMRPDLASDETESESESEGEEEMDDETDVEPVVTPKRQTVGETTDDDSGAATGLLFLARSA